MAYVVLGLGRTGLSAVRYLKNQGHDVMVADTRKKPPNLKIFQQKFPDVSLTIGHLPVEEMQKAQAVIVPPGLSLDNPLFDKLKKSGVNIWGDIELFAQNVQAPVLGITGANGKSTVTSLVAAMIRRAAKPVLVGGNIGVPALDLLAAQNPEFYVIELSSFQLETTYSLKPTVASILNISRDHLDRHGSLEAYVDAKQRIYQGAQWAVYNRQDKLTVPKCEVPQHITFGLDEPQPGHFGLRQVNGQSYLCYGDELLLPTTDIKLFGRHNVLNALSALAIGNAAAIPMECMLDELRDFEDLKHRCQIVRNLSNVIWINDTKGTNVGATKAAIESVAQAVTGKIILIAGGKAKDTDFSDLEDLVKNHVSKIMLIGEDGPVVGKALEAYAPTEFCGQLSNAILQASKLCHPGDAVLLSPACTSLDAYANFEERGEAFIQAVNELK